MTPTETEQLHLRFKGDWGRANLTRLCGWLTSQVGERTGTVVHTIHTGRGMADNILAVATGDDDISVSTPAQFARMAREGRGLFEGKGIPELRALGNVPHDDGLLFAIPAELGIKTFAELREAKPKLKISLSEDDGESFMGYGASSILKASGIDPQDIVDWGGEFFYGEDPLTCVNHLNEGRADSLIQEAIMTGWWRKLTDARDFNFLSLEDDAVERLDKEFAISTMTVKKGRLRGIDEDIIAADFGGWQVLTTEALDDSVAEMIAAILVETPQVMESQYAHLPIEQSSLDYPITAEKLVNVSIPLHHGAAKYYAGLGLKPNL